MLLADLPSSISSASWYGGNRFNKRYTLPRLVAIPKLIDYPVPYLNILDNFIFKRITRPCGGCCGKEGVEGESVDSEDVIEL